MIIEAYEKAIDHASATAKTDDDRERLRGLILARNSFVQGTKEDK